MCQCVVYTLFGCYIMVAVPVKILVCMGWLSVDCCAEGGVGFYGEECPGRIVCIVVWVLQL